jgi:hypothetical protein
MPSSSSSFRECAIWAMALKSVALCRAKSDKWLVLSSSFSMAHDCFPLASSIIHSHTPSDHAIYAGMIWKLVWPS